MNSTHLSEIQALPAYATSRGLWVFSQLQAIGYLRAGRFIDKSKGYRYYHVTASGAAALMFDLPRHNRRAA